MGKTETVSIEEQVSKLQAEKQSELEKILSRYKEKEAGLVATLKSEIADLKAALKAKEKSLEKLTGKPAVARAGTSNGKVDIKILVLTELDGGQELKPAEIKSRIAAKNPNVNTGSVGTQVPQYAKKGLVAKGERGYLITEAGKQELAQFKP